MTLAYNEIRPKKIIILDGEPYEVLDSHVFRKQQRKPVNQTKLRHLTTGKVTEQSFHQSEKVEEAEIGKREIEYIYYRTNPRLPAGRQGEWWFADPKNPKDRFTLPEEMVGGAKDFLKEKDTVEALIFDDAVISIRMPIKVTLTVAETPPGVRGDTAQGGTKHATLETGAVVSVPLFINIGDRIVVNTETRTYVERA